MKIIKTWKTPKGIEVIVTGEVVTEKTVWLDGDTDTVPTVELKLMVTANGMPQGARVVELTAAQKAKLPAGCEYVVGQLPLTRAQAVMIEEVELEIKRHPAMMAKQALIAKNQREIAAYNKAIKDCKGGYEDRNTY